MTFCPLPRPNCQSQAICTDESAAKEHESVLQVFRQPHHSAVFSSGCLDPFWSPHLHLMVSGRSLVSNHAWRKHLLSCVRLKCSFLPQLAQFTSQVFSTEEEAEQVKPLQNNFRHIHPTFSRVISASKDAKLLTGTASHPLRSAESVHLLQIILLGSFMSGL